ncbi:uncharacterized protein PAC_13526 [Phialocephala subalpina]|uniref:BZIP domain-containing protein n=1 Tax=Phialocephala subalpina TaxID=576137 RepID=A0A1L7XF05_9HELO|nr:uncharacterized protein PAC_13526 [Phialocephala subalpina]
MRRAYGVSTNELHDNTYQTDTSILFAEAHSGILAQMVVSPTATTTDSAVEPTLEIVGRQSRGETTRLTSHAEDKNSRRHKGRPRISTVDQTQAERRRTQIRQAQRNFRLRKENTIQSLQNKVSNMEEGISQTSKACLNFQEKVLASGVLDQAPELSHSLWSMVKTITSLTQLIVLDQDVDGNDAVLFPLQTQDPKADQERIESLAAKEQHPHFEREYKGQAARNVNVPETEIQGRGTSRRIVERRDCSLELPLLRQIKETPLYDVFLEGFLDAFSPAGPSIYGAFDLIRVAAASRTLSPILDKAFQSASLAYYGQKVGDLRIVISGRAIYSKVLNALQNTLSSPEQSRSIEVLLTVIVLIAHEVLQYSSRGSILNHSIGALKLVELRGPFNHVSGLGHICYVQYRHHLVATALICRSRTFLASEDWKIIPWSARSSTKDLTQHLLDHVADIPALLGQFDSLTESAKTGSLSSSKALDQQAILRTTVADAKCRLHRWKKEWVDTYPIGQPYEVPAQTGDSGRPMTFLSSKSQLPIFRCRDLITKEIITPTLLAYPDPQLALTLCIYYGALILLLRIDTRPDETQLPEIYYHACLVCRSMEYCIREPSGTLMKRVGFSLRVAYDALPKGDIEAQWVEKVFGRVAKEKFTKSWGSLLSDISVES